MKTYADGLTWGEGPRWNNGALWVSDTQGSRLWTDSNGVWSAIPVESPSNGLWFLPDGSLVAAMMHQQRIGIWNGSAFDTYADLSHLDPGPLGDIVGDTQGNLYVDDVAFAAHAGEAPRPGRLLRVDRDNKASVAAEGLEFPNGLAFINSGRTLVVAESSAQRLTAFSVGPDGALDRQRIYADIAQLVGPDARPDGIWPAEDGIWVATLSGHAVVKVRDGELVDSIDAGERYPIACCVDDRQRLFVTLADTAGKPLMQAITDKSVNTTVVVIDL